MWHVWGRGEVHTKFGWGSLRERDWFEEFGVDEKITLNWTLKK
jgi:hypothetical protein